MKNNTLKNGKIIKFDKYHVDFKGIKFAIDALDKNKVERRPHRKGLFFDAGIVVGTNGYQLNTYELSLRYTDGLYDVIFINSQVIVLQRIMSKKQTLSVYPPWKDSFKEKGDVYFDIQYSSKHDFSKLCYDIFTNMRVNFLNIDTLKCIPYGSWEAEIVNKENLTVMVMLKNEQDRMSSIIMPIRG